MYLQDPKFHLIALFKQSLIDFLIPSLSNSSVHVPVHTILVRRWFSGVVEGRVLRQFCLFGSSAQTTWHCKIIDRYYQSGELIVCWVHYLRGFPHLVPLSTSVLKACAHSRQGGCVYNWKRRKEPNGIRNGKKDENNFLIHVHNAMHLCIPNSLWWHIPLDAKVNDM